MLILAISIFLIFIVIILFSSKKFSPIPYYPSNKKDLKLILKTLEIKNDQTIIDLGAGDGWIIFESAKVALRKNLNTKFIAVEINPILILIIYLKRFTNPNKRNINIVYNDMFKMKFDDLTSDISHLTFYLYISPWFLDVVSKKLLNEFPKAKIVSYMYPIRILKKKERIIQGKNRIYIYA